MTTTNYPTLIVPADHGGICGHCGRFRVTNADWTGDVALLNPTAFDLMAYHNSAECVTADPVGTNYHSAGNLGR